MKRITLILAACIIASCQQVPGRNANAAPSYAETQRAPNAPGGVADLARQASGNKGVIEAPPVPEVAVKRVVKVGLLLPLTGRHAELGKAMQDAATVSLFDKYARLSVVQQATKVELMPVDTGDSPELARKAMTAALADGAEIIIGPVFGDATEASAHQAAAKNVPVLSFSNNRARGVAPNTYLMGFSPQEQALRVVRYAVENGKKRIAVLVPKTPLGEEVLTAARAVAKESGKVVIIESTYAANAVGLEAAVSKLLPTGETPHFDALLMAETGAPLESVLRALSARGITQANMQFMGTGVWDDTALLSRTNLDGAWLASSNPVATSEFDARFRSVYGYAPPRISSLAYDAVALAVTLAVSNRPFNQEALTAGRGFMGPANGLFRLRPNGAVDRGLAVLQVEGSGLKVISPAPTGF